MIKTCLFDLGNVLAFFSHDRMCEQLARLCGVGAHETKHLVMSKSMADPWERGMLNRYDIILALENHFHRKIDSQLIELAFADIFTENTEIVGLINHLKEERIRLVLLSNTCDMHFEFLESRLSVLSLFDEFVLSYKVGFRKPEVEIFEAAKRVIDCQPEECFFTDDIEAYVNKARELGFAGATFRTTIELIEDLKMSGVHTSMD